MTEIKEITPPASIKAYMLMRLTKDGMFTQLPPTYGTNKIIGGLWASKEEACHEQLIKALLGEQYRVFEIDWSL